ncbi:MAG: methylmalonyl-CoA mutase family protein, partial [Bdellovibrio sp.]
MAYTVKNSVRIVTAAALFDGHDASINIMRRILQDMGAEVIHLGHNRSVQDVVKAVLQEGAQGVCISSYQGGHMEYFKYMKDLLNEAGAAYVQIFGGGGGVIVHEEKKELEAYGITQIFHPDDGRKLGLEGMIEMVVRGCDFNILEKQKKAGKNIFEKDPVPSMQLGVALSAIENGQSDVSLEKFSLEGFRRQNKEPLVLGITGTGGAGKSSLIDELVQRYLNAYPDKKIAVICVDPSKRKTGGSLLGDRIRMNSLSRSRVYMRSVASRGSGREIASSLPELLKFVKQLDFDFIIAETSGIGQGNMAITEVSDLSMYVMTSDFGAQSQLEKIDMIDFADLIAVNKADRRGALDALRDVTKQYKRSRKIFDEKVSVPVFLTQASQFNDGGVNKLFFKLSDILNEKQPGVWQVDSTYRANVLAADEHAIIPADRQGYLAEIVTTIHKYKKRTEDLAERASQWGAVRKAAAVLGASAESVKKIESELRADFTQEEVEQLQTFEELQKRYAGDELVFKVRDKELKQALVRESLSGTKVRRVVVPKFKDWGDRFRYLKLENVPGEFPYTAGVFQLKRADEDPKRMFAGEGTPERTNRRFHYLTKGETAHRLSTAFDSVTLYGQDPDRRPDIFGKVGESGVSICTLVDMKKLYAGFDLINPNTSVSMTINGPAPMILAFYFNTAIDQQIEKKEAQLGRALTPKEWQETAEWTLQQVRGTVQA